ncbi:MAG: GYD domain-containing protein [bacterium]
MPTYVALITWTDQGARAVKDTVRRYEAAREQAEELGVTFKDIHWTMGAYDAVAIVEARDDVAASTFSLAVGSLGNIRTVTMRAYNKDEMSGILNRLP